MDSFFYILLFIFGTMFGSFGSVVIHRLKSWESGIWTGRSHCKTCDRNLSPIELIPILSWVFQLWKCRWCNSKISAIYPILEITTGLLFAGVGYFLVDPSLISLWYTPEMIKLWYLLIIAFLTIVYVFYDILYLEIPESILIIANILTLIALAVLDKWSPLLIWNIILSLWVVGLLYTIMLKWFKEIYDIALFALACVGVYLYTQVFWVSYHNSFLISGIIWALGIFGFFFAQIVVSWGKWMGWWDLRIAILMGLTLGVMFSFAGVMLSYFAGSIIWVGLILWQKSRKWWKEQFSTQVPFGPFLACGYFGVLFFAEYINTLMKIYL